MKFLKIAVLPVILLLSLLMMGGCATSTEIIGKDPKSGATVLKKEASYGTEYTVSLLKKIPYFVSKKVTVLPPTVVEKNMETKKTPGAVEKVVAEEVYAALKKELTNRGVLAESGNKNTLTLDLNVHYISLPFAHIPREYYGDRVGWMTGDRGVGGQILATRLRLKNEQTDVAFINSIDNDGIIFSYQKLIDRTSFELANQIEKILKEGVNVEKSP